MDKDNERRQSLLLTMTMLETACMEMLDTIATERAALQEQADHPAGVVSA